MQPASEECSYLEELSCKEKSLKDNRFCFNQTWYNSFVSVYFPNNVSMLLFLLVPEFLRDESFDHNIKRRMLVQSPDEGQQQHACTCRIY